MTWGMHSKDMCGSLAHYRKFPLGDPRYNWTIWFNPYETTPHSHGHTPNPQLAHGQFSIPFLSLIRRLRNQTVGGGHPQPLPRLPPQPPPNWLDPLEIQPALPTTPQIDHDSFYPTITTTNPTTSEFPDSESLASHKQFWTLCCQERPYVPVFSAPNLSEPNLSEDDSSQDSIKIDNRLHAWIDNTEPNPDAHSPSLYETLTGTGALPFKFSKLH
jgi:hypothetical protein